MGNLFKDQTKLHIEATLGIDITGATIHTIKYILPDKTTGSWAATIKTAATGILQYDVNTDGSETNWSGTAIVWGYVTLSDGRKIAGEAKHMRLLEEGTV